MKNLNSAPHIQTYGLWYQQRPLASARIKSQIKSYFSLTLFNLHVLKKYFSKLQGLQASKLRLVCLDDVFFLPKSPPALESRQTTNQSATIN